MPRWRVELLSKSWPFKLARWRVSLGQETRIVELKSVGLRERKVVYVDGKEAGRQRSMFGRNDRVDFSIDLPARSYPAAVFPFCEPPVRHRLW